LSGIALELRAKGFGVGAVNSCPSPVISVYYKILFSRKWSISHDA